MSMYEDLAAQLGMDLTDPTDALARDLIEADDQLLEDLVSLRKESGLKPSEVARRMGRDRSAVTQFEKLTADPRLSTIRRYALAIGARITHHVDRAAHTPRPHPSVDVVWVNPGDLQLRQVRVTYSHRAGVARHASASKFFNSAVWSPETSRA